jgi:hypothetical protein
VIEFPVCSPASADYWRDSESLESGLFPNLSRRFDAGSTGILVADLG